MKAVVSPAESLDFESKLPTTRSSQPQFLEEAETLNKKLERKTKAEISDLMSISDKLADLNYQRYKEFSTPFTKENARPAVYAFAGDVYTGLDAYTIPTEKLDKLEDTLRILSGLYGVLKPLDIISPYRLEMGTKISVAKKKDLYEFWKEEITNHLNKDLKATSTLVNLASIEYFSSVDTEKLKSRVISPVFKDFKNGQFKIISFYAKKARGLMAKYLIENRAKTPEDLYKFNLDGYKFSKKDSTEDSPVFLRK